MELKYYITTHNLTRPMSAKQVILNFAQWNHPLELEKSFTDHDLAFYSQLIKPGSTVLDIGAFTGDTSVVFGLVAGPEGTVHCFEPNPHSFDILLVNSEINRETMHLVCHNYAIMPVSRDYEFHYVDQGFCNGGYRRDQVEGEFQDRMPFPIVVKGQPIPPIWLNKNTSFVKVDTERHDLEVLRGIEPFLNACRPALQFEVYPNMATEKKIELVKYVESLEYCVFIRDGENLFPWFWGMGWNGEKREFPIDLYAK